ncbi:MAG TPA: hypothetical protein VLX61_05170 [Anaerolineales bacterium]|nr:hypothetical protein [Anaerolineales bacterium]
MASKTKTRHIAVTFGVFLLVMASLVAQPVSARSLRDDPALPGLASFVQSVRDGDRNTPRGVYAEGLFAFPIVQQPDHDSAYVSAQPNVVTEFSTASAYGNIGLLAHDFLAGQYFAQLAVGQKIQLIGGDGQIENFAVTQIYRYQATDPSSVYSHFIDLSSQETLSSTELFTKVYAGPMHITFQTCIEANGDMSWGRLFVIAEPQAATAAQ